MQDRTKHPAAKGMRYLLYGAIVNFVLALLKGAAAYYGHSSALMADAVESLFDVFSSLLIFYGLHLATRPPDHNHPYGHGKAEPLAALLGALGLGAAACMIAYHSLLEISAPQEAPESYTLFVLVIVVAVKEFLFRRLHTHAANANSLALAADAWHQRSDALTSLAAFVGISIAVFGGTGYESADDWAALIAAFVIGLNAVILLRPALDELSDAAPPPEFESRIRHSARSVAGVKDLEKCFVRKMGFSYYVDLHVIVDGNLSVRDGHAIAHAVEDEIRRSLPEIYEVLVHIEPD